MEEDDARSLFLGIEIVFRSVYPKVITAGYDVSLGVKIIVLCFCAHGAKYDSYCKNYSNY